MGIDLVSVDAVRDSIEVHGQHYLQRVYCATELADCSSDGRVSAEQLAGRFAAKEAVFKVLRAAEQTVSWTDVEVRRDHDGAPTLTLHGGAAKLAAQAGISELALSISHEGDVAGAVVVADGG